MSVIKKIKVIILIITSVIFLLVLPLHSANDRIEQIKTMEQEIQSLRKTLVDLESRLTDSNSKEAELANKLQEAIDARKVVVLASRARSAIIEVNSHAPEEYKRGYLLLANGKIPEAEQAFEEFVKNNTGDSYVVNARYWLGEIKYYNGNYQEANKDFIYVYRNSTNEYYKPYALYRILEVFSALQRMQDACKVAEVLSAKYLDKFFSFEVENIKDIVKDNKCNTTFNTKTTKVDEEKDNPFGHDTKIMPANPKPLQETFTDEDKKVLQDALGKESATEDTGGLQEIETPNIDDDHVNSSIENNTFYNMKKPQVVVEDAMPENSNNSTNTSSTVEKGVDKPTIKEDANSPASEPTAEENTSNSNESNMISEDVQGGSYQYDK